MLKITLASFQAWLRSAKPGSSFPYYRGSMWHDAWEPLHSIAWAQYEAGQVDLVQQRCGDRDYIYIAQKRRTE